PFEKSGEQLHDVKRRQLRRHDSLVRQGAVDQFPKEFDRRLASNHTPPASARPVPMRSEDFQRKLYNTASVVCPLCGTRKARRGCPAVGQQICPVCCGTKRLVEIACPGDCPWLASAREHPPAVAVRRHQRELGLVVQFMRDLNERQSELFFLVAMFLT